MTQAPSARAAPRLGSVIIPARDVAGVLAGQLRALAEQTYAGPWEVVVADNGSADGTAAVARANAGRVPALRIVDASGRRGINHARNRGAEEARGDFLLFCDADDEVSPEWLARMTDAARSHDVVGGPLDRRALNDPLTASWRWPSADDRLPVAHGFLPYAEGSNFGIWAEVLRALGGWNEDYAGGADDVELCWRAQLAGYRIGFAPHATIRYRYRRELGAMARQVFGYGFGDTKLYRDFRGRGLRRPSFRYRVGEWCRLVGRAPELFQSPESRGAWVRDAAYWAGRVRGSLHHRVPFV